MGGLVALHVAKMKPSSIIDELILGSPIIR